MMRKTGVLNSSSTSSITSEETKTATIKSDSEEESSEEVPLKVTELETYTKIWDSFPERERV